MGEADSGNETLPAEAGGEAPEAVKLILDVCVTDPAPPNHHKPAFLSLSFFFFNSFPITSLSGDALASLSSCLLTCDMKIGIRRGGSQPVRVSPVSHPLL